MAHEGARHWEERRHLTQSELHSADDEADEHVAQESAERPAGLESAAETEEEAGSLEKRVR